MAVTQLTAANVKYSTPVRISVGSFYLTATNIEFPTEKEFTEEGGVELNLEKLLGPGIDTTRAVLGNFPGTPLTEAEVGEIASTSPLPVAAWSTAIVELKPSNESLKPSSKNYPTTVVNNKGKLFLKIFIQETAAANTALIEPKKARVDLCGCTVFTISK